TPILHDVEACRGGDRAASPPTDGELVSAGKHNAVGLLPMDSRGHLRVTTSLAATWPARQKSLRFQTESPQRGEPAFRATNGRSVSHGCTTRKRMRARCCGCTGSSYGNSLKPWLCHGQVVRSP